MPTYLKYIYIFLSIRIKVGSGSDFFQLSLILIQRKKYPHPSFTSNAFTLKDSYWFFKNPSIAGSQIPIIFHGARNKLEIST